MGNCLGKPNTVESKQQPTSSNSKNTSSPAAAGQKSKLKDWGLGDRYEPVKFLGRGGTSDTWLFRDLRTKELVAVKLIKRPIPPVLITSVIREIQIQADLGFGHCNVIQAYEAILTSQAFALVMEFAAGGSLTSYVSERFDRARTAGLFLTEDEARYFFKQFIEAVSYCHANNVAHRDLKLDNTLLDNSDPPIVKLCDFGFAKTWQAEEANMFTHIGTPVYMAPELVAPDALPGMGGQESKVVTNGGKKGYDGRKVDIWASGILLLVMLLGAFPFDHIHNQDPNAKEAHLEIWMQQMQLKWSQMPRVAKAVDKLTPELIDLLDKIMIVDENQRIPLEEIKVHPWYIKPLATQYQAGWEKLQDRQAKLDESRKDIQLNEKLKRARYAKIQQLVEMAAKRPDASKGEDKPIYVDLREEGLLDSAPQESLTKIVE